MVKGIDALATEDETICHMLIAMESDAVPVYNCSSKQKTQKNVIKLCDEYFEPVKSVIYERLVFYKMVQMVQVNLYTHL